VRLPGVDRLNFGGRSFVEKPRHFVNDAFAVCMAALPKSAGRDSRNCYAAIRTQQIIPRLAI
jgi:hypothetical protein